MGGGDQQLPQIPVDPNLASEKDQANNDLVASLQTVTQGDMASLMARYGTQLALSGYRGGTPLASPATGARAP